MARLTRRDLILRSAALGCSAAASPLLTPVSFASMPSDNRLVVIILRGAMDGLDVVQPMGDPAFRLARPDFQLGPEEGNHDLDGFFSMHRALEPLMPLWQAGDLGFVQAVSTPYRNKRSHFDGQDLLEAGTPDGTEGQAHTDGWLNRLLQNMPNARRETALAVGREEALILRGAAASVSWSPSARLALSDATSDLLGYLYRNDPLFDDAFQNAEFYSSLLYGDFGSEEMADGEMAEMMQEMIDQSNQSNSVQSLASFAAERLRADARIASFSIGGWDTHRSQIGGLQRPLRTLATAILRLRDGLGPAWSQTTVLAMTEFGRTVHQNGSQGTDHGTGGAMLLAGGAVRGGRVYGDWPGLDEADLFDRRDLMPTRDVRAYAAWAMRGLFGIERSALESHIYPELDMGSDPSILL